MIAFLRRWQVTIAFLILGVTGVTSVYLITRHATEDVDDALHKTCLQGRTIYRNQQVVLQTLRSIIIPVSLVPTVPPPIQVMAKETLPELNAALRRVERPPLTCR